MNIKHAKVLWKTVKSNVLSQPNRFATVKCGVGAEQMMLEIHADKASHM